MKRGGKHNQPYKPLVPNPTGTLPRAIDPNVPSTSTGITSAEASGSTIIQPGGAEIVNFGTLNITTDRREDRDVEVEDEEEEEEGEAGNQLRFEAEKRKLEKMLADTNDIELIVNELTLAEFNTLKRRLQKHNREANRELGDAFIECLNLEDEVGRVLPRQERSRSEPPNIDEVYRKTFFCQCRQCAHCVGVNAIIGKEFFDMQTQQLENLRGQIIDQFNLIDKHFLKRFNILRSTTVDHNKKEQEERQRFHNMQSKLEHEIVELKNQLEYVRQHGRLPEVNISTTTATPRTRTNTATATTNRSNTLVLPKITTPTRSLPQTITRTRPLIQESERLRENLHEIENLRKRVLSRQHTLTRNERMSLPKPIKDIRIEPPDYVEYDNIPDSEANFSREYLVLEDTPYQYHPNRWYEMPRENQPMGRVNNPITNRMTPPPPPLGHINNPITIRDTGNEVRL